MLRLLLTGTYGIKRLGSVLVLLLIVQAQGMFIYYARQLLNEENIQIVLSSF